MTNHPIGNYGVEIDFYRSFVPQAKEILTGNIIVDMYKGPLYQILLAFAGILFNNDFFSAGKFINIIFASVSLFYIFKLSELLLDKKYSIFITLFVAVNVNFLQFTYEPCSDLLFLTLYISSVYYLLKYVSSSDDNNCMYAGILCGLAYLTRYTALSLLFGTLIIFAFIYFNAGLSKNVSDKKTIIRKSFIKYILPVIICITVWGVVTYSKTGKIFYNYNYYNTASAVFKPDEMHNDEWTSVYEHTFTSLYDVAATDYGRFFKKIFIDNFTGYFISDMHLLIPFYLGIICVIGLVLFLIKLKSNSKIQNYYFIITLIFYLQIILTFYSERFTIPLIPFYLFVVLYIFNYVFIKRIHNRTGKVRLIYFMFILLVVVNSVQSFSAISKKINSVPVGILNIADWMNKNSKENFKGKIIMSRAPHIAYYLDMKFEVIPYTVSYNDLLSDMKNKNAEFLYINQWEVNMLDKNLFNKLLKYNEPPAELEVIAFSNNPAAVIYKLKK